MRLRLTEFIATVAGLMLALNAFAETRPAHLARTLSPAAPVGQTVTAEQIRAAIEQAVQERLAAVAADVQVRLLDEPEPFTIPAGRVELRVKHADDVVGRRAFQLAVTVDGSPARSLTVRADTTAWTDVAAAARSLKPNDIVEADDLVMTRLPLTSAKADVLRSIDAAVGKRVTRPMPAGKPLSGAALSEPYAVRRGDRVTIEAKRGGLLIQTAGITKGAAQAGEAVTVTNLDSGKDIRARAVGPGTVRVEY